MAIETVYPGAIDDETSIPSPYTYTYQGEINEPHAHRDTHLAVANATKALEAMVGTSGAPNVVVTFADAAARTASTVANKTIAWTTSESTLKIKIGGTWVPLGQATTVVTSGVVIAADWSLQDFVGWRNGINAQFRLRFTRTGASANAFSGLQIATLPTGLRGTIDTELGCIHSGGPQLISTVYTPTNGILKSVGSSNVTVDTGNAFTVTFTGQVDV